MEHNRPERKENILCISNYKWGGMTGLSSSLMREMARYHKVLYFEPPMPYMPIGQNFRWHNLTSWRQGIEMINDNLMICKTPPVLPGKRILRSVNRQAQRKLAGYIIDVMNSLHFEKPILITFCPHSADLLKYLGYELALYFCGDEVLGGKYKRKRTILGIEEELLKKVDCTVVVSKELYKRKKDSCRELFIITNGTDHNHFCVAGKEVDPPLEMDSIKKPIAGFLGAVDHRINIEFIRKASEELKDWSFVLVGPVYKNRNQLLKLNNVYLLGQKNYEQLPRFLSQFDVCTIPYILDDMTINCFPIKLYEYFSSGKPVVASNLPALEEHAGLVYIANCADDFPREILRAYDESNDKRKKRIMIAERNSWEHKAEGLEYILQYLRSKQPLNSGPPDANLKRN
ncbi:MAG: glycosyltransferase family 1 protein [Candidatus Omnitrophota bacterium]|jgi:glycosyltransferase involved in cell wall biosynthesis|nr:MAG: glycosyltransferase family 1 protein [Candidatus Omnitrophota bacterium]